MAAGAYRPADIRRCPITGRMSRRVDLQGIVDVRGGRDVGGDERVMHSRGVAHPRGKAWGSARPPEVFLGANLVGSSAPSTWRTRAEGPDHPHGKGAPRTVEARARRRSRRQVAVRACSCRRRSVIHSGGTAASSANPDGQMTGSARKAAIGTAQRRPVCRRQARRWPPAQAGAEPRTTGRRKQVLVGPRSWRWMREA